MAMPLTVPRYTIQDLESFPDDGSRYELLDGILSDDLAAAMERYTRMGFVVQRGGRHPGAGSENALVGLADGSYLEIIALLDPQHAATHRFWQMAGGRVKPAGAYGGYALGTPDLAAALAGIQVRGLPMVGPRAGARARPWGQLGCWWHAP